MTVLHHPVFQSLVLPVLLAGLGIAALRAGLGARHAAWGGLLGLLGALVWFPGFDWPALARTQKLPWIVCAGLGLAALEALRRGDRWRPVLPWLATMLIWGAAAVWLGGGSAGPAALVSALVFGAAVLALLVFPALPSGSPGEGPQRQALTAVVLAGAGLGLAGLSATGGSLLLAQLALMLASSVAVVGLWAGLRPASGLVLSPGLLLAFGLAWLAIGGSWLLAAPGAGSALGLDTVSAVRLLLLALAFAAPAVLRWLPLTGRATRWRVAMTLLLAAVPVLVALVWAGDIGPGTPAEPTDDGDDLYLTPSWR
jgi:hypothetical protein